MLSERMSRREPPVQSGFRLRGAGEVSRVEALSDGVIAFAITLLYWHAYRKREALSLTSWSRTTRRRSFRRTP